MISNNPAYTVHIADRTDAIDATEWNALLAQQSHPTPFMRHAYLTALTESGSATADTGWSLQMVCLRREDGLLQAACALYVKDHSYGEYVFDWAWANAYAQHGLDYYPKAVVAIPFTPVPGIRLLAVDAPARLALVRTLVALSQTNKLSSLHLLFASDEDVAACAEAGLMLRHTVQFHWQNKALKDPSPSDAPAIDAEPMLGVGSATGAATRAPSTPSELLPSAVAITGEGATPFTDFEDFLKSLTQEKRKKIRQERRKVADAGVTFRSVQGAAISAADWDFFYRCYERTYLEHGNAPYLTRAFFQSMAETMPEAWVIFIAERSGQPIATSLIAVDPDNAWAEGTFQSGNAQRAAYGRYWGALERVDCLHFEACFYQPIAWCIAHGIARFEGGAQGEHKMARALMPTATTSAHWLAHPSFADAVERFLEREDVGVSRYLQALESRSPFKSA